MRERATNPAQGDAATLGERFAAAFAMFLFGLLPGMPLFLLANRLISGAWLPGPILPWSALYWIIGAGVAFGFLLPRMSLEFLRWTWDCTVEIFKLTWWWW